MTPEEKRILLKRARLKEALSRESRGSEDLSEPVEKPQQDFSDTESALAGGAQAFGYETLDELYGARKGVQDVTIGDYKLKELPERYRANRDEARNYYNQAQEQNPMSYMGGAVIGGGASAFVPGYNLGKAGKVGSAVAGSGLSALGASEKESAFGNIEDAGKGAATGYLFDKVLGKVKTPTPSSVRKYANEKAVVASGAMTTQMRELMTKDMVDRQGRWLLRNKVVTPLASLEDVAERSGKLRKEAGEKIGSIVDTVDSLRNRAISEIQTRLKGHPQEKYLVPGLTKKIQDEFGFNYNTVADRIDELIKRDRVIGTAHYDRPKLITLSDAFREIGADGSGPLRDGLRNKTDHRKRLKNFDSLAEDYKQEVYDILSEELDRAVINTERLQAGVEKLTKSAVPDFKENLLPDAGGASTGLVPIQPKVLTPKPDDANQAAKTAIERFKEANQNYAGAAVAEKTAKSRLGTVSANRDFGITTAIATAAGLGSGGAPAAVAMGLGNNFFRKYGSPLQATGANRLANMLDGVGATKLEKMVLENPQYFGKYAGPLKEALKRGTRQFVVANYVIGKNDPQYQSFLEQLLTGDEK